MSELSAEEWGRAAMALPGWRWMPGMLTRAGSRRVIAPMVVAGASMYRGRVEPPESGSADGWCRAWACNYDPAVDDALSDSAPNPDDPATAGCLLALLGDGWCATIEGGLFALWRREDSRDLEGLSSIEEYRADHRMHIEATLGRACIAAAEALGCWPGCAA